MTTSVTATLAAFAGDGAALPEEVRHAGRRTVLNAVALAVGAARHPAAEAALAAARALGTPPQAGLLGRPERLGLTWAPLVTGIAVHVEDYDDTHLATVVHPGAPVVPAALAAAEWVGADGAAALDAVVVGVEVAARVGLGLGPGHFDRGWHLTGTAGHVGAAAAAGRLLGLDHAAMVSCLGLAATQAAGLQEALGTMTKPFHPGKAAADGVEAALLAAEGFTGPPAALEGRRGLLAVAAPKPDPDAVVAGLGTVWETCRNTFKPYACGIVSHPVIDGAVALRGRVPDPEAVTAVTVTVNPVVLDVMGIADPVDGLQSKFSVYHCFAVGLLDGVAGPAQYTDERARAPEVAALRAKVRVVGDPAVARDEAHVEVRTRDGATVAHHVEHATGSEQRPLSDAQLAHKARLVVGPVLGAATDAFVDLASRLDGLSGVDVLVAASQPPKEERRA